MAGNRFFGVWAIKMHYLGQYCQLGLEPFFGVLALKMHYLGHRYENYAFIAFFGFFLDKMAKITFLRICGKLIGLNYSKRNRSMHIQVKMRGQSPSSEQRLRSYGK